MNELLEPIIQSPKFPELARTLNEAWEAEQRRRVEFLEWITPSMKAEFILGEVVLHSPARARHLEATANLFLNLRGFCERRELGKVFSEKCMVSLTRNDYEPDIVFFGPEKAAEIDPDQMRFPAPDLIVEILSESTESRDRGIKFRDYAAHGVREYWIVDTLALSIEQYVLEAGSDSYALREKMGHGSIRSVVVEGFEIELAAIFAT